MLRLYVRTCSKRTCPLRLGLPGGADAGQRDVQRPPDALRRGAGEHLVQRTGVAEALVGAAFMGPSGAADGVAPAAPPVRFGGDGGDVEHQREAARRGQAGGGQTARDRVGQGDGVLAIGQHAGREPGESVVAQQHVQVGGADCLQPGAGIVVEAGVEVDVGQHPVQDASMQFLQGARVGIQGRGPSLQLFGQAAQGDRFHVLALRAPPR
ncbi:hypothetical protein [Streptomyces sp. NPDC093260]|uniref:hypothetical protein n=1 Tax=Streptomyces sp. NPDC093260 TaxID=3155073 RepID=UPI00344A6D8E